MADIEHSGPAREAWTITPDDDDAQTNVPREIYVGGGGDVTLRAIGSDADVVFKNVPAGGRVAVRALYIRATGTSATFLIGQR